MCKQQCPAAAGPADGDGQHWAGNSGGTDTRMQQVAGSAAGAPSGGIPNPGSGRPVLHLQVGPWGSLNGDLLAELLELVGRAHHTALGV